VKLRQRQFTRRFAIATGVALAASIGVSGTAGAQTAAPGVTDKAVTIGYITSETGAASSIYSKSGKACQARVDAQNAKGGVNGRKIDLQLVDDKSANNLTAAQDLVQNRDAFMVVDNSALAFLAYRYLLDAGVPMIGPGFDGTYYFDKGNENIISGVGNQASVPGLTYDTPIRVMKRLGATKVASVGYSASPSSSEAAKLTSDVAAPALGLKGVYVNNALDFGSTDVGPVVLGIKNSGANGAYLPLNADTNFAIVQGLQQNGVDMKANVLATGYGQALLDEPIAKTMTPADVIIAGFRPVELKNAAVKEFQANLKKYAGLDEVPDLGMYTGYINCDMMIKGLEAAGKNPTRQGFVDAVRGLQNYDGAGLSCQPLTLSAEKYGTVDPTACTWMVGVKNGKFVVLNHGKPIIGKIVGSPELLAKYGVTSGGTSSSGASATTTSTP
jgi:branched-chain amino acid transport system substrate-binding protein